MSISIIKKDPLEEEQLIDMLGNPFYKEDEVIIRRSTSSMRAPMLVKGRVINILPKSIVVSEVSSNARNRHINKNKIKHEVLSIEPIKHLVNVIKSWESLPEGHYRSDDIEKWLVEKVAPSIKQARKLIGDYGTDNN